MPCFENTSLSRTAVSVEQIKPAHPNHLKSVIKLVLFFSLHPDSDHLATVKLKRWSEPSRGARGMKTFILFRVPNWKGENNNNKFKIIKIRCSTDNIQPSAGKSKCMYINFKQSDSHDCAKIPYKKDSIFMQTHWRIGSRKISKIYDIAVLLPRKLVTPFLLKCWK